MRSPRDYTDEERRIIGDGWPDAAEGGTTIDLPKGADHDFMASDWIPFLLGVFVSSGMWILVLILGVG